MSTVSTHPAPTDVDVLIVGAGISGIGAGCHLRRSAPDRSFAILEARDGIGGTWDLFRYPGIRSDSDLQTFGYAFKPWTKERSIAPADEILEYLQETVEEYGLADQIHFGHRVTAAAWSSADARWTVTVEHAGEQRELTCGVLFGATGYYNYKAGHTPEFPGRERFEGVIVHPQQWPEDLQVAGRRVVVIGSGATAMTLIPAIAREATHVTMLQRSPTYVVSLPAKDPVANALRKVLPEQVAYNITRTLNIRRQGLFYDLCQKHPRVMREVIRCQTMAQLPRGYPVDRHFKPAYNPWDQRICVVPDGDLFRAIRRGRASIETGRIREFVPGGIKLQSGDVLAADVIVTATGLDLLAFGGLELAVDGEPVELSETVAYKSMMLSGVPNFCFAVGYTNASWTLKVDLVCKHLCRLLNHMAATGDEVFTPQLDGEIELRPLLDFQAGYVKRSVQRFPKQGSAEPWTVAMSYAADRRRLLHGPVEDPALRLGARAAERVAV